MPSFRLIPWFLLGVFAATAGDAPRTHFDYRREAVAAYQRKDYAAMATASKAALISLTKSLAQEWGPEIRVNVILPGLTKTQFAEPLWSNDEIAREVTGRTPLQRIAEPEEISGLAVFLASDAGSYCTGSLFPVDGGYLI